MTDNKTTPVPAENQRVSVIRGVMPFYLAVASLLIQFARMVAFLFGPSRTLSDASGDLAILALALALSAMLVQFERVEAE